MESGHLDKRPESLCATVFHETFSCFFSAGPSSCLHSKFILVLHLSLNLCLIFELKHLLTSFCAWPEMFSSSFRKNCQLTLQHFKVQESGVTDIMFLHMATLHCAREPITKETLDIHLLVGRIDFALSACTLRQAWNTKYASMDNTLITEHHRC